jgi:LacI family trehalose operon transcriptional repressor
MRGGSQKVIGIIISRLDSPSENRAVSSILQAIYANGYDAVIMESQFSRDKTNEHLEVLRRRNVDGIIVFGFSDCDIQPLVKWDNRVVVIAMDTEEVSSINYDNTGVVTKAIDAVTRQNLTNIAYIGVDPSDKTTGLLRLNAYLNWCEKSCITPNYRTGELSHESAYQICADVISEQTQAIVCASDTLAFGVIKRLQELGREDIMVTGVGGNELLSFLFPKVISIDPGYQQAGQKAVEVLLAQFSGDTNRTHITQRPL